MKALTLSLIGSMLLFISAAKADSGQFCNQHNQRVEWVCNATPSGYGWVNMGNNCYHRETGMSCSSHGGGGYNPYQPMPMPFFPDRGRVECRASDKGWEEHGSHGSCGECLREHGSCRETCSIEEVTCKAEGLDERGNTVTFIGQGYDRFSAEDQAIRNCAFNARRCYIDQCNSSKEVVSRRDCRR